METELSVAVVGASSLVGEMLVQLLEERAFPVGELHLLGADRALGRTLTFQGRELPLKPVTGFEFSQVQLAFFCAGAQVSREVAPQAAAAGCLVIDSTTAFREDEEVPLVVPEVNPHTIARGAERRMLASPGSAAIQLVVALQPLQKSCGLERISVATYQAVSAAGRDAIEELAQQSIALLSGRGAPEAHRIARQIAFNCVPQIGDFEADGQTREERRIAQEIRKVLEAPTLRINATAVRVPVFYGHSAAVSITTGTPISPAHARALLAVSPGVTVFDELRPGGYPTAATEATNQDTVYVGRIREDPSVERGLNLWIVADNVRKGAATNSLQIAEAWARLPI
jgi:aspartate-semialdehyde dehydrogenase